MKASPSFDDTGCFTNDDSEDKYLIVTLSIPSASTDTNTTIPGQGNKPVTTQLWYYLSNPDNNTATIRLTTITDSSGQKYLSTESTSTSKKR